MFIVEVLTLANFLLEPICEDYIILDKVVEDSEHALDSILTDSVKKLEWHPLMSLMLLLLQSFQGSYTQHIPDNSMPATS